MKFHASNKNLNERFNSYQQIGHSGSRNFPSSNSININNHATSQNSLFNRNHSHHHHTHQYNHHHRHQQQQQQSSSTARPVHMMQSTHFQASRNHSYEANKLFKLTNLMKSSTTSDEPNVLAENKSLLNRNGSSQNLSKHVKPTPNESANLPPVNTNRSYEARSIRRQTTLSPLRNYG